MPPSTIATCGVFLGVAAAALVAGVGIACWGVLSGHRAAERSGSEAGGRWLAVGVFVAGAR